MAQSIITLSNEELTHLCETSIDQKKGSLFYNIIRVLGLNVKAIPLTVNGKEKPLLYIPGFTWLIDLNHNAAHEFIEDPSLATQSFAFDPTTTAISELLKPYGEEFDRCIYCPLCNIIQGDDDNFIV